MQTALTTELDGTAQACRRWQPMVTRVRVSDYLTMSALSALIAIHEAAKRPGAGDDSPISASMYDRLERDKLIDARSADL
jgi:hypothetical protein